MVMNALLVAGMAALVGASPALSGYTGNNPGRLNWGPPPAGMPKGVKMIVVSGDPAQAGPYTIRLRFAPGYMIGPHRHPTEEKIKILAGGMSFGMGPSKQADIRSMSRGSNAVVPANTYPFASTSVGATVEFTGTGPFRIDYADAKDDPR
jgi:hypothetical protein